MTPEQLLLIAPEGIEIVLLQYDACQCQILLIAPEGIEIYVVVYNLNYVSMLLIAPEGIEIACSKQMIPATMYS